MGTNGYARARRRVAVVEPHVMQRMKTVEVLRDEAELDVVHASGSLRALVKWLRVVGRSTWPHLLVIEMLPDAATDQDRAVVAQLRRAGVRVLLLSTLVPRIAARRIVDAGIDGVVSKHDEPGRLLSCVAAALAGERPVTAMARSLMADDPRTPRLSEQEARVLELYVSGHPVAKAADIVGVQPGTARKYLSRVKQKYDALGRPATSLVDLIRLAREDGLVH